MDQALFAYAFVLRMTIRHWAFVYWLLSTLAKVTTPFCIKSFEKRTGKDCTVSSVFCTLTTFTPTTIICCISNKSVSISPSVFCKFFCTNTVKLSYFCSPLLSKSKSSSFMGSSLSIQSLGQTYLQAMPSKGFKPPKSTAQFLLSNSGQPNVNLNCKLYPCNKWQWTICIETV